MVGAEGFLGDFASVIVSRTDPDRDARQSCDLLDAANELRGSEDPLVLFEARCEIRDFDDAALAVREDGLDDSGVAQIACARLDLIGQDDVAEPFLLVACEQPGKYGIGVEAGRAPPDDPGFGVEHRGDAAVSDQREVHVAGWRHAVTASEWSMLASHDLTAAGSTKVPVTSGKTSRTEYACPPSSRTV